MREPSSIFVHKLDFSRSKDRIKAYLNSKGKDDWDSYFPMGTYGYMEVSDDCYILNSYGEGISKPINETNPASIPFHGERGDLMKGTYRYSREPVIQSRYFGNLQRFFVKEVVSLDKFILPKCEEKYWLWENFGNQMVDAYNTAEVGLCDAKKADGAASEEKDEFDVVLKEIGALKISVIMAVRELTPLGLKEAKDLVEAAPKPILEGASKDDADAAKSKLEETGAVVEVTSWENRHVCDDDCEVA